MKKVYFDLSIFRWEVVRLLTVLKRKFNFCFLKTYLFGIIRSYATEFCSIRFYYTCKLLCFKVIAIYIFTVRTLSENHSVFLDNIYSFCSKSMTESLITIALLSRNLYYMLLKHRFGRIASAHINIDWFFHVFIFYLRFNYNLFFSLFDFEFQIRSVIFFCIVTFYLKILITFITHNTYHPTSLKFNLFSIM